MKVDDKIWNNKKLFIAPETTHKEFFDKYKADLVFWNQVGRGLIETTSEAIEKQQNLVEEEKKETVTALINRDKLLLIDGLCDVAYTELLLEYMLDTVGVCINVESYYDSILDCQQDNWERNIRGLLTSFAGDWKGALAEVSASNWTKFDVYDHQESKEGGPYDAHCKKLRDEGKHYEVKWTKRGEYVVYQNENDKILKGREYRKPELGQFI